jgi:lipoprotein-anchoring transpeptidase ErfK/SrfK
MEQGRPVRVYPVSTSKFCVGDRPGSFGTPLGRLAVAKKIGGGAAPGTVFKSRRPTGEVLPPNAPGRDPIVSRILWLRGEQAQNRLAYGRCIYIHGTPEEWAIGHPASYGCVRMRSMDVIDLFDRVPEGTPVRISQSRLPAAARELAEAQAAAYAAVAAVTPVGAGATQPGAGAGPPPAAAGGTAAPVAGRAAERDAGARLASSAGRFGPQGPRARGKASTGG